MTRSAELMRAIRGPVVLITLGALLLADRFSGVPVTKTWPVLLIVFGLMKLLERTAGAPGAGGGARYQG
jgi:hypothetical protein